jgi:hypothetical protein
MGLKYKVYNTRDIMDEDFLGLLRENSFRATYNDMYVVFGHARDFFNKDNGIHSLSWWVTWSDNEYQIITAGFTDLDIMDNSKSLCGWSVHHTRDCPMSRLVTLVHGNKTAQQLLDIHSQIPWALRGR